MYEYELDFKSIEAFSTSTVRTFFLNPEGQTYETDSEQNPSDSKVSYLKCHLKAILGLNFGVLADHKKLCPNDQ